MLDLEHLRAIVAVAEHASFRRAATALGRNQSVVSRRVRAVEEHIGVSLFLREQGGARLTGAGRAFLTRANRIVTDLENAVNDARRTGAGSSDLK